MTSVLIIGSGPNAVTAQKWNMADFDAVVAINNAWRVVPEWTHLIYPDDFGSDRMPPHLNATQTRVTSHDYVPAQNLFGGFVYAGGTMAFTAAYWALATLRPSTISVIGCDMVYPSSGNTHFYGTGTADPLRDDISLRSLAAKSARLMALAARENCAMLNLSSDPSVLTFPRALPQKSAACAPLQYSAAAVAAALQAESDLGYYVPSGKYWKQEHQFDPHSIDRIDAMWLALAPRVQ